MLNDYQLALQLQDLYDGKIALVPNSPVDFSIVDDGDGVGFLYEGSHDIRDAMNDLEALMTDCPFGRVHSGAWKGIQESLPSSIPLEAKIRLRGHSLGSMRAAMAACELYQRGYLNLEVVTFESPRWGDRDAIAYFSNITKNRTYQNYLNLFEHDAFTMIPLHLPLEPYQEVPNCKRFWSAPTPNNEYKDFPLNIQAHSLSDCVIPYLRSACAPA